MIRVAIIDLYDGYANQGMRCIREILHEFSLREQLEVSVIEFDLRQKSEIPDLSFDIYISTGGPGSPLDSEGSDWENLYFTWLEAVLDFNAANTEQSFKKVFFICHSFQLVSRYWALGEVSKRKSTSFGVFPIHLIPGTDGEKVFRGLHDPFYAVDSRDYQLIKPNHIRLREMGAKILCIEKDRPHVPLERAVMAIRFNEHMIGTQFHPEADPIGMSLHLQTEERKQTVITNYGFEKWSSMIEHLEDPDKIMLTHDHILPNFLHLSALQFQEASLA